ncbi:MAG: diacylglycerol kinase family lipid kinase [Chloroflexi bacterium]|nr:diacylglycerol kinase family lipid kinase [Chloroflexota bacterium]
MHAFFIRNPISGNPDLQRALDLAMKEFEAAGWRLDVHLTEYKGHARDLAEQAAREGYPVIIVAGGDGSIGQTVDGLVRAGVNGARLGVIPLGTGNVFARDLGLPFPTRLNPRAPVRAARIILQGDAIPLDVGMANGHAFMCWAGCGIDAAVTEQVENKLLSDKRRSPLMTYIKQALRLLRDYEPAHMRVRIDERETLEGHFYLAVASNIGLYARYLLLAPSAHINDGLLDLLLIDVEHLSRFVIAALKTVAPLAGLQTRLEDPHIIRRRFTRVRIESEPPLPYHLDGDPFATTPLDIRVLPRHAPVFLDRARVTRRLQTERLP